MKGMLGCYWWVVVKYIRKLLHHEGLMQEMLLEVRREPLRNVVEAECLPRHSGTRTIRETSHIALQEFFGCTGCSGKLCFFTIHCNPSLAFISVRDRQSSQSNTSVQSRILGGIFFVQQIAAKCWRG